MRKFEVVVTIVFLSASVLCLAGDRFEYGFDKNDTLSYQISIDGKVHFKELQSLAQLFNLDNINHIANIEVDLVVESLLADRSANIRSIFKKISMVIIAGDSVFTDDGSNWGAFKPGSEYSFVITPQGEITDFSGSDTALARQGVEMIQRFFPHFPNNEIEKGYQWDDTVSFELEIPGKKLTEIQSQVTYLYDGMIDAGNDYYQFKSTTDGNSIDNTVKLSGDGYLYFDKSKGRIIKNSGDFLIGAEIDLMAFGLPSGLGRGVPVDIDSKIEIELKDGR